MKKWLGITHLGSMELILFGLLSVVVLGSCFLAAITSEPLVLVLPAGVLLAYQTLVNYRSIFFLLVGCIPMSHEIYLSNSLGTDLPAEPLMIVLAFIFIIISLKYIKNIDIKFIIHPIILVFGLHYAWMLVTTIFSNLPIVSIKFIFIKTCYLLTFLFLAGHILKDKKNIKLFFWVFFIPMLLAVLITLFRQALDGFAFAFIDDAMDPFFRNHVDYAAVLTLFYPFIWYARKWYSRYSWQWWLLVFALVIFLLAIYLSFTRAAYIALAGAATATIVIQWRLIRWALLAASIGAAFMIASLVHKNAYLDLAPNYERTITHKDFDNLLAATYNMEDISTMERLYRWVAAAHMSQEELTTGFGPGNFYFFYKSYTLSSFQTYVSDNPERSGIHSYYLMMLVDQGIPGFIFYMIFIFFILIKGEKIYHETKDPFRRNIIMTAMMVFLMVDAFQLINDLLETMKVGSLFFISMALLINMDLKNQREKASS